VGLEVPVGPEALLQDPEAPEVLERREDPLYQEVLERREDPLDNDNIAMNSDLTFFYI
jgi:hypothetical protein